MKQKRLTQSPGRRRSRRYSKTGVEVSLSVLFNFYYLFLLVKLTDTMLPRRIIAIICRRLVHIISKLTPNTVPFTEIRSLSRLRHWTLDIRH